CDADRRHRKKAHLCNRLRPRNLSLGEQRPNSAAAPDRVPFVGPAPAAPRFSATLCVALQEPKGTRSGERQSVGRTEVLAYPPPSHRLAGAPASRSSLQCQTSLERF